MLPSAARAIFPRKRDSATIAWYDPHCGQSWFHRHWPLCQPFARRQPSCLISQGAMMTTSGISSARSPVFPDDLDSSMNPLPTTARRDANAADGRTPPEQGPAFGPSAADGAEAGSAGPQTRVGEPVPKSTFSTAERLAALRAGLQARSGEGPAKEAAAVLAAGETSDADLQAQSSDASQRVRRTPPPPTASQPNKTPTFDAYAGPSTGNNGLGFSAMQQAAEDPHALPNHCAGLVTSGFYNIATGGRRIWRT